MIDIERITEECMGATARQANLHLHAAMEQSRRNIEQVASKCVKIMASIGKSIPPIISDSTPQWITKSLANPQQPTLKNRHRVQYRTMTNEDLEKMYEHGEA